MIGPDMANVFGFVGMALILLAYGYQTAVAERANPLAQHGLNLIGALLLVASLLVHVNLASLILESVWAVIAVYGLVKAWRNESPSRLREGLGVGKSGVAEAGPPPAPPASGSGDT